MGIFDSMFGKVEPSTVSSISTLTKDQAELLRKLTEIVSGQIGKGVEAYPKSITAGSSPLQQQSWDAISKLISGGTQPDASKQAIEKILAGTGEIPKYDVGEFDPAAIHQWYKDALYKPAMEAWEKDVVPTVQEKFIAQNAGSSGAANRAISGSAADVMRDLNSQLATALMGEKSAFDTRKYSTETDYINKLFESGQGDLSRMVNVPGIENQSMEQFFKALGLGEVAGATQQGIDQNKLVEDYTKWQQSQPYSNPWLKFLGSTMGTSASEPVVTGGEAKEGWLKPAAEVGKIIASW